MGLDELHSIENMNTSGVLLTKTKKVKVPSFMQQKLGFSASYGEENVHFVEASAVMINIPG